MLLCDSSNSATDITHVIWVQSYKALYGEIYEILPTEMICHVERMQNQGMPEQIAIARIQGTIKGGRPRKIWKVEDLNIMGIKTGRQRSDTGGNWGRLYWKLRFTTDCIAWGGGGRGGGGWGLVIVVQVMTGIVYNFCSSPVYLGRSNQAGSEGRSM